MNNHTERGCKKPAPDTNQSTPVTNHVDHTNHVKNSIASQSKKIIWLSRHGQSEYNLEDKIGGNPPLSDRGIQYAQKLFEWFRGEFAPYTDKLEIWTSTLKRTHETVQYFSIQFRQFPALDELNAGICDGMTYEEIKQNMPEVHNARTADKLNYRYPEGESYVDVASRVKPILRELEKNENPVLVVAHQGVIRTILGHFIQTPEHELPHLEVPLETVFQLELMKDGSYKETRFNLKCGSIKLINSGSLTSNQALDDIPPSSS